MRIAIYTRKSIDTGRGESIENQEEMCRDYILSRIEGGREAEILVYEDEGFSGKSMNRPQFKKMMTDLKNRKPDYIVCYRLDRISRSVCDFSSLIESLNNRKINFVCIKEQFDTSSPMGRAMMYIASVFAQLERETIAERVRDNMMLLAKTGRWLGGTPPTGFRSKKVEEIIFEGKKKLSFTLEVDQEEIGAVQMMFRKYLELKSLGGVFRHLIQRGTAGRNGKPFSVAGIKDILRNPVYCSADKEAHCYFTEHNAKVCFDGEGGEFGLLSYNKRDYTRRGAPRADESKWIVAQGRHLGIVCGADWIRTQKYLTENRPANRSDGSSTNGYALLSGCLFCKSCCSKMISKPRSGQDGRYDYICGKKLKWGDACGCPNLNGQEADRMVWEYLSAQAERLLSFRDLLVELRERLNRKSEMGSMSGLLETEKRIRKEINGLMAAAASAEGNSSMIRHVSLRVEELDARMAEVQALLRMREEKQNHMTEEDVGGACLAESIGSFRAIGQRLSAAEKREIVRLLVSRAEWDGEELHIFAYRFVSNS